MFHSGSASAKWAKCCSPCSFRSFISINLQSKWWKLLQWSNAEVRHMRSHLQSTSKTNGIENKIYIYSRRQQKKRSASKMGKCVCVRAWDRCKNAHANHSSFHLFASDTLKIVNACHLAKPIGTMIKRNEMHTDIGRGTGNGKGGGGGRRLR